MKNSSPGPDTEQTRTGTLAPVAVRPSERTTRIHYAIRDIMQVAQQARRDGKQLVYLNIGDPILYDFRTPAHLIEATYQAMLAGHTGYAPSEGIQEALQAIRAEAEQQGIRNIRDVFLASGVSEAVEIAVAGLLDTG